MCDGIPDVSFNQKSLYAETQEMSTIPERTRKKLNKEARDWDSCIKKEIPEETEKLLEEAEPFHAQRPPREPVSLRMDPFDLAMIKRLARRRGMPYTQLMAMWLHEKIELEKTKASTSQGR
jgi:predicted DNA binding CopG/RHH family protein